METRQKTEYKLYVLYLSDMRGNVDRSTPIAVFDDINKLSEYYKSNLAECPYLDDPSQDYFGNTHSFNKVFKKGSPLEWYNAPRNLDPVTYGDAAFGGVVEEWFDSLSFTIPFNP